MGALASLLNALNCCANKHILIHIETDPQDKEPEQPPPETPRTHIPKSPRYSHHKHKATEFGHIVPSL